MATRPASPEAATQIAAPGMLGQRPPISQQADGVLRGWRPSFVFLARIDRLEVVAGQVLPDLARVDAVPGRGGNTSADVLDPAGWCASMERQGYRRVPNDLDFEVWGVSARAACQSGCTYRVYQATDRVAGLWHEAWTRPKILGAITRWPVDHAGKRAFQAEVLKWLLNGATLDSDLVEAACAPVIETARAYHRNESPTTLPRLLDAVAQLPPDHVPPDLARFAPKAA